MTEIDRIPVLIPMAVGASAVAGTILIHALSVNVSISFVRRERRLGRMGAGFWVDVAIVALAVLFALVAHLVEIALWAGLFQILGEFSAFGNAFYHSAVNYTTLGYGDVVMGPSWKVLGPLEAANGVLLFGVSTAMIFALVLSLIHARFMDLK